MDFILLKNQNWKVLYMAAVMCSDIVVLITFFVPFFFRNMILAERCVLLSAEILKSQSKYSEAAALLIRLTSEVLKMCGTCFSQHYLMILKSLCSLESVCKTKSGGNLSLGFYNMASLVLC